MALTDWQTSLQNVSMRAKILAIKWNGSIRRPNQALKESEVLRKCKLPETYWKAEFPGLVKELNDNGLKILVQIMSGESTYTREFVLNNERGDGLRVMVGVAFMEGGDWHDQGSFELIGYTDHQKIVQEMKDYGYPTEKETDNATGRTQYRLPVYEPQYLPRKHFVPTGLKKTRLYMRDDFTCRVCGRKLGAAALNPDHRIPNNRGGQVLLTDAHWMDAYQTLCVSCNHEKRETCKKCLNMEPTICSTCYWHDPQDYRHVATNAGVVDTIVWNDADIVIREQLREDAKRQGVKLSEYVKVRLAASLITKPE